MDLLVQVKIWFEDESHRSLLRDFYCNALVSKEHAKEGIGYRISGISDWVNLHINKTIAPPHYKAIMDINISTSSSLNSLAVSFREWIAQEVITKFSMGKASRNAIENHEHFVNCYNREGFIAWLANEAKKSLGEDLKHHKVYASPTKIITLINNSKLFAQKPS